MTTIVKTFFDEATFTASHIVIDPTTKSAAIIDSVLDFDLASGRTNTRSADKLIDFIKTEELTVEWILETHVHADHISAAAHLKKTVGGKTGIGDHVGVIQETFGNIFNVGPEFHRDGSQFEKLFADDEIFSIGSLTAQVLHTPGHTPACVVYLIGDAAFVGDTLFMPDYGSARCDFPGGDARTLFHSIQRLFSLPDDTRLFMCHDYKAPGRDHFSWETTIGDEKTKNIHLANATEESFVQMREDRDATLSMPKLILPAVQVNMRAGDFPPADSNGVSYLKLPINGV